MAFKAPIEYQKLGESTEERVCGLIGKELLSRGSDLIVSRGSPEPRYNAEFGDVHVRAEDWEFPRAMVEVKFSNYPRSFSMSDEEFRSSKVHWVVVEGPMGIWAVTLDEAKKGQIITEGEGRNKHHTIYPRVEYMTSLSAVLDDIQVRCGEFPRAKQGLLGALLNEKMS